MSRHSRIGIIGTGWVGSSIAISCLHRGLAQELLLHDRREGLAEGEAMDLVHGSSYYPAATVRSAGIPDMLGTDAVVMAAGRNGGPGESRLDLLRDNAAATADIAAQFRAYRGVVIMVANPVDVLASVFLRHSGLPAERVIGTGTMLDTARLRQVLGAELGLNPVSVHAQVVGEHGDSEVPLWSSAQAGGMALRDWPGWSRSREAELAATVRHAAYEIIRRKGATNHAIGLVTANLLQAVLRDEQRILTVSREHDDLAGATGAAGTPRVALSLPCVVGSAGATRLILPQMDGAERAALLHSAQVLAAALGNAGS